MKPKESRTYVDLVRNLGGQVIKLEPSKEGRINPFQITFEDLGYIGFEGEKEYEEIVAKIDRTDVKNIEKFVDWRENDKTKDGLLKIVDGGEN